MSDKLLAFYTAPLKALGAVQFYCDNTWCLNEGCKCGGYNGSGHFDHGCICGLQAVVDAFGDV